ncbi:TlpA disulfide reductase family protein [Runella slithyformis]|uniref:TlpA disulfide reductase family protein n=1 Tax=Runella slithyformis TaxID=106 RepID=UPI000694061A
MGNIIGLLSIRLFWGQSKPPDLRSKLCKMEGNTENFVTIVRYNTYVVNFLAAWCRPCVAEMPYFEEIQQNCKGTNVRVSMDFAKDSTTRVIPFIHQHRITGKV